MIRALPRGVLSGESLDVNTVVREFDASEAAAEALLAWEIELDKTLIERDNTMMEIDLDALVATLENDDKAARDAARSESKVRRDVRDANLEAIDSIAELMGEQANDFRLAAWQKAFPACTEKPCSNEPFVQFETWKALTRWCLRP